ncbi:tRNA pseudouridine(55) synthase TruB [Nocardioides marinquilinus]|uniref:tRNA pseudouridine synthase B n=1 Tax=Nocardioides marinquilinus TaxID=1210400 RepID=A0ABP9PTC4_9ACTN
MSATPVRPGLVVVDKPTGPTSHDVVARVRRLAGTRKVGHAGTLDPMATGVLVLGVDRATRLLGHLTLSEKAYEATIRLGETTTTDDAEGETTASAPVDHLTDEAVREALAAQVGEIQQRPSAVSAVKVDGRRAYQRVRDGEDVVLEPRTVTVHELTVLELALPDVRVRVRCSSGTYIRAIARDAGALLGVGGHLTALRRTAVGPFLDAEARTLDDLADDFGVVPLGDAARRCFPAVELSADEAVDVRHGRRLARPLDAVSAVFDPDGEFLALYGPAPEGSRAVAVLV